MVPVNSIRGGGIFVQFRNMISRLAVICSFAFALSAAAASPVAPLGDAWQNRMTWGATSLNHSNIAASSTDRWLSTPSVQMPPAARAQIAAMQIEQTPMPELMEKMQVKYRAMSVVKDPAEKKIAKTVFEQSMNRLLDEARSRCILRALYSPEQLKEQMTWFWYNHFNVYAGKRDIRAMVGDYENTLRSGALGNFRELLEATLKHPAMLRYLDNDRNSLGHINENYAREIMELHSMGVGAGYNQKDVEELARILTGVGVRIGAGAPKLKPEWRHLYIRSGLFEFNPARHDFGSKRFLGHVIKGTGLGEVEQALDLIVKSPATARHISIKLATYFMGDAPPTAVIRAMAQEFRASQGDISRVIRVMIKHPAFPGSLGKKFKNPVQYAISAIRITYGGRVITNARPVANWIKHMGAPLYARQTPDGYSMISASWSSSGQMAARFAVARQIGSGGGGLFGSANELEKHPPSPDILGSYSGTDLNGMLSKQTQNALANAKSRKEWNVFFLSSPEFMYR